MRATLSLESRFECVEVAERVLADLRDQSGCDEDDEFAVMTALREVLANAIRHGHQECFEKRVEIVMEIDREFLTIEVGDHGEGFAVEAIPDPRDAENLLKPCGRGIFYMRRFMDEVTFRRRVGGGTMVTMKRKLSSKATKENQ